MTTKELVGFCLQQANQYPEERFYWTECAARWMVQYAGK
jgi:hypothetical protein